MFQGFLWNINSFDQEGVQLGKLLANKVLQGGDGDEALQEYMKILAPNTNFNSEKNE
jgi:glucose-6-phosphate isomerase